MSNINNNNNKNKKKMPPRKNGTKSLIIYTIVALLFVFSLNYAKSMLTTKEISYNQFIQLVENNEVEKVKVDGDSIVITPKSTSKESGKVLYTGVVNDDNFVTLLNEKNVQLYGNITEDTSFLTEILVYYLLPLLLFGGMLFFITKKMGGKMGGNPMNMGKSNAKMYVEKDVKVTFDDVAGQDEAKESLTEIIEFLNTPKKYAEIGAKLPKGALLVGPPGTGKTLIAKAVAGEAKVPFFSMSGSNFVEMFVGMGAAKVRDLFKEAEKHAPCIIFIDEIDSIGKSRDGQMQSNDEREQTLNQLLTEMDGFDATKGIVILGATNRPETLDKALLRPGRFDRRVIVDRPDYPGRLAILQVHSKDVKMANDIDLDAIAKTTAGAVGADLANMINEAAIRAVNNGRDEVMQEDLEEALEVVIAGKEKKDRIMSKTERESVAYHEVGHALVAEMLDGTDPVHKITIVPRTKGSLGYTLQFSEDDKYLQSREDMLNEITTLLAGRSAEEEVFNLVSTGASNDIERATAIARNMVTVYGMSDNFDMVALESIQNRYLDGRAVRNCSEETSTLIDKEILSIIRECHAKARRILSENREILDKISQYLLEKETILGDEFMEFVYEKYPEKRIEKEKKEKEKEALKAKRKQEVEAKKAAEASKLNLDKESKDESEVAVDEIVTKESNSEEVVNVDESETVTEIAEEAGEIEELNTDNSDEKIDESETVAEIVEEAEVAEENENKTDK